MKITALKACVICKYSIIVSLKTKMELRLYKLPTFQTIKNNASNPIKRQVSEQHFL